MKTVISIFVTGAATLLLCILGSRPVAAWPASAVGDAANPAGRLHYALHRRDYYEDEEKKLGEQLSCIFLVGPFDCLTAKRCADRASQWAVEYDRSGQLTGLHNGKADAFRHCTWNALMVHAIGADQAKEVADNHEDKSGGPDVEKTMDLANNEIGRQVGISTGTDEDAKQQCYEKANNGALRTL